MLAGIFKLEARGTSVRTELIAGATTFLTMAYIVVVNPSILADAGIDPGAAFVATCLAAAVGTALMGVLTNYPIALAPGMGLNAFFTYGVVVSMGHAWQTALGAVFISGTIFLALSVTRFRETVVNTIPRSLQLATAAGIGFFIAFIGLRNAGVVVADPTTLVTVGNLGEATVLLAVVCFLAIVALEARKVPGALLIAILGTTFAAVALGLQPWTGVVSTPPSIAPTFFALDIRAALDVQLIAVIFAIFIVDLFDSAGTLIGTAHIGGFLDRDGKLPRLREALAADSAATVVGACMGTSPVTAYIESVPGIRAGGRTGLTALVVTGFFLLMLFFAPLAAMVPTYAAAPALIYVGCIMARSLTDIDWNDLTEYTPALLTAISMPLTFSITTGLGLGFVSYAAVKAATGRAREVPIGVYPIALAFIVFFAVD